MKKTIAFYLDDSIIEWLRDEAEKNDRSVSWVLNELLIKQMKEDK
jgi:hypothetical protein